MPTATYLLERKRLLAAVVCGCVLIGLVAAKLNVGGAGLQVSAATTNVRVDTPSPSIEDRRALPQDLSTLVKHTELLARTAVTRPVLDRAAELAGIPKDQIAGVGRMTAFVPLSLTEPNSEQRASEIDWSNHRYRVEAQASPTTPTMEIYAQAPSTEEAEKLADATVTALRSYLDDLAGKQGLPEKHAVQLYQLAPARGGVVNGGATPTIFGLTFLVAFCLSLTAALGVIALRVRRAAGPAPAREDRRDITPVEDAWPHTTRLLPWMIAAFICLLWLVPFNSIQLSASLPIDLKGDRLVLPFLIAVWILAIAAGGRYAPRLRMTWIHATLGIFLAVAFLGVVLDARYLNHSLELDLSFKKLPLVVSYVSLFVIVASGVRLAEVPAFLKLTLGLGVILALGMIWEYRFKQNLFYDWSDKLLPGAFTVVQDSADEVDGLGRRLVRGSAGVPLEAVTMLSFALPVAIVGLLGAERRARLLYGLAACLLVAAMFATYRKSALLAPIAVVLTIAYFRRSELLKLAPLGMASLVLVSVLSPGAIGTTIGLFTRSDAAEVPTVSDRTSDYDAVRPDVWSHLAFGRGWGSYNHVDYRILDSEILHRTIEMGVLGLVTFILMILSVVAVARGPIASRDPIAAPAALVGASGAIAFLMAATLYDVMSFPHGPYIFLYLSGLVVVVVTQRHRSAPAPFHPRMARRRERRPAGHREPVPQHAERQR